MMELKVKIEANELTQAILKLASAIEGSSSGMSIEPKSAQNIQPAVSTFTPQATHVQPSVSIATTPVPITQPTPMQNTYTVPTAPIAPVTSTQAPIQQAPVSAPIAHPIPTQTAPTSVPNYTIEQLQTAIAPLLDAGKVQQIQALVQSFGVNTLMDIPQERYGEFANGLRALGGVL